MAFGNTYIFGFATVVCVVCSVAVASVSMGLKDQQEANKRRDRQVNILAALGLPEDGAPLLGSEIDAMFDERVDLRFVTPEGEVVEGAEHDLDGDGDLDLDDVDRARQQVKGTEAKPSLGAVYVRLDGDRVGAYAIPMYGSGLWGPISGFLALGADGREVMGSTFFAPKETPGLGAEIMEPKFEQQWVGKKVVGPDGRTIAIDVVKGEAEALCPERLYACVDGVSGATITSRGVDEMVEEAMAFYDPYLKRIRGS